MDSIFCIVSAIGNDYGVFTYRQRFNQLLSTVASIKKRSPNSDIVIYDASEDPLPEDDVLYLRKLVNNVTFLKDDKYVSFLKYNSKDPSPNKFEKKTVGEMRCMHEFLKFLKSYPKKYDRVFKLSGRYMLSDNFTLEDYKDKINKCVLLNKEDWYGEHVFTLRLWSFDYKHLSLITELFDLMQNHTYDVVIQTSNFEIIEFTFTKFMEKLNIPYVTVNKIGVCGLMGLGGKKIDE